MQETGQNDCKQVDYCEGSFGLCKCLLGSANDHYVPITGLTTKMPVGEASI